jgi:hypothetical protein
VTGFLQEEVEPAFGGQPGNERGGGARVVEGGVGGRIADR